MYDFPDPFPPLLALLIDIRVYWRPEQCVGNLPLGAGWKLSVFRGGIWTWVTRIAMSKRWPLSHHLHKEWLELWITKDH